MNFPVASSGRLLVTSPAALFFENGRLSDEPAVVVIGCQHCVFLFDGAV